MERHGVVSFLSGRIVCFLYKVRGGFSWDDLEYLPLLTGCGTQHPLRALCGTRVLLAAAPTTPPCFRHWRRSSSLLDFLAELDF